MSSSEKLKITTNAGSSIASADARSNGKDAHIISTDNSNNQNTGAIISKPESAPVDTVSISTKDSSQTGKTDTGAQNPQPSAKTDNNNKTPTPVENTSPTKETTPVSPQNSTGDANKDSKTASDTGKVVEAGFGFVSSDSVSKWWSSVTDSAQKMWDSLTKSSGNNDYTYMNKTSDGYFNITDGSKRAQDKLKSFDKDGNNLVNDTEANNIMKGVNGSVWDRTGDGNVSTMEFLASEEATDEAFSYNPDGVITQDETDATSGSYQNQKSHNHIEIFTHDLDELYNKTGSPSLSQRDKGPWLNQTF